MRYYLLISHGKFAQGASETLQFFLGEQHQFQTINAYIDQYDPKLELDNFFNQIHDEDEVIICTDLLGGSVNQFAIPYLKRAHTFLIAGFNLPMLMELSFLSEPATATSIRNIIEKAKESITFMNDYQFLMDDIED